MTRKAQAGYYAEKCTARALRDARARSSRLLQAPWSATTTSPTTSTAPLPWAFHSLQLWISRPHVVVPSCPFPPPLARCIRPRPHFRRPCARTRQHSDCSRHVPRHACLQHTQLGIHRQHHPRRAHYPRSVGYWEVYTSTLLPRCLNDVELGLALIFG